MRGLIAAALLIGVVAGGGYLYHTATTPFRTLPPVEVDAAHATAAERKIDGLRGVGTEGGRPGQPATVTESFSDSELSSLANQELRNQSLPLDNVVLHATAAGTIEGLATAHWGGQSLPLFLVATVQVVGGNRLQLTIIDSKLGQLSVPAPLADQINSAARQSLSLGQSLGMDRATVTVTLGMVTVSGVTSAP
jgi:hypothetical protein